MTFEQDERGWHKALAYCEAMNRSGDTGLLYQMALKFGVSKENVLHRKESAAKSRHGAKFARRVGMLLFGSQK
jgi:hypothetical protein